MKQCLPLLLSLWLIACNGPGPLDMSQEKVQGKKASFTKPVGTPSFTEMTFGAALAQSAANWACSPSCPSTGHQPSNVEASKQDSIIKYSPTARIADGVKRELTQELRWKESSDPDYEVHVGSAGWGIRHHPLKLAVYNIYFNGSMTVASTHIAEGKKSPPSAWFSCRYQTDSKYTYDEVFANEAAAVKEAMDEAVPACIKQITEGVKARVVKDSAKSATK